LKIAGALMRLLLVDHDDVLRCLMGEFLLDQGHSVDLAVNGVEALASINANRYDVVICDSEIPLMDGPTLCRTVRQGTTGRVPYFIMLIDRSAPEATAVEAEGFDSTIDACLTKPCEPADLLAALRTAQIQIQTG
jgi:phosphoserine phosphatase RsbU/P